MKISKLYQLINDSIVEIPLMDIDELNDRLLNIENNYLKLTGGTLTGVVYMDVTSAPDNSLAKGFLVKSAIDRGNPPDSSNTRFVDSIVVLDKSGERLSYIETVQDPDNAIHSFLYTNHVVDGENVYAYVGSRVRADGTAEGIASHPSLTAYNNSIATTHFTKSVCAQKMNNDIVLYIGKTNASDTADLNNGRGLSEDKPFATLQAAINFASSNYTSSLRAVDFRFMEPMSSPGFNIYGHSAKWFRISAKSPDIEITFTSSSFVNCSSVYLSDISVKYDPTSYGYGVYIDPISDLHLGNIPKITGSGKITDIFTVYGFIDIQSSFKTTISGTMERFINAVFGGRSGSNSASSITFGNCVINQVAFRADLHSAIFLNSSAITGSFTGKRYEAQKNSTIYVGGRGVNTIPGTIEGTCDESSVYA